VASDSSALCACAVRLGRGGQRMIPKLKLYHGEALHDKHDNAHTHSHSTCKYTFWILVGDVPAPIKGRAPGVDVTTPSDNKTSGLGGFLL